MKVVTAEEMVRIENLAYERGGQETAFMDGAGQGVADCIQRLIASLHRFPRIVFLCGGGNNAGDAYVAARLLGKGGYEISVIALAPYERSSPLCQLQSKAYRLQNGRIHYVTRSDEIDFGNAELIVDGILGTGFKGKVEGLYYSAISQANASGVPILAIDIPSGINGTTGEVGDVAIKAHATLFLGLPKTGCFLGEAWHYTGRPLLHDFGIGQFATTEAHANFEWLHRAMIREFLPEIDRCRHKYQRGYVVGVGGSKGMSGAAVLSSLSALRAGAGIVRLFHPEGMETAQVPLEVIHQSYGGVGEILEEMERASVVFIGPGLGKGQEAVAMLRELLPQINKPSVIDADALSLIAVHDLPLPKKAILTPHVGEMLRLLKLDKEPSHQKLLELTQRYCEERDVIVNLKGAPTFLFCPKKVPHICSRGDPGMATAGAGDVLTGVIAAAVAQIEDAWKGALFGSYIHAMAGERAAKEKTSYCMIASDLIEMLPKVFKELINLSSILN